MKPIRKLRSLSSASSKNAKGASTPALMIDPVPIDKHCTGTRWATADFDLLARIVAIIAMGQSAHAARIIAQLAPTEPAIDDNALRSNAIDTLSIRSGSAPQRYQRDGFLFEAISWVAARQSTAGNPLLRDPHIKSTTQGLDGLMIELDEGISGITRATIFEDKCSENPRRVFRDEIVPTFIKYHEQKRAAELVASAAALLEKAGFSGTEATIAAGRVLDKDYRAYRGSLAITAMDDSQAKRQDLFKGYDKLTGITAPQRIGAVFITGDDLRAWFDELAEHTITYINSL